MTEIRNTDAAAPSALLELAGVHKYFNRGTLSEVHALRDVSLSIAKGEFIVVVGQNGSGKSTLLQAIAGSYAPEVGTLHLNGIDITHWPDFRRARFIARVFQDPFTGTAAGLSIAENFAIASRRGIRRGLGRALNARLRSDIAARCRALGLGLEERLDVPIGTLSGGQRQALTLLMAVWQQPEILLLDEHTSALDPRSAELIIRLSKEIVTDAAITTLMVTHSLQDAINLGDRLIMMHRGRVVHDVSGADKRHLRVPDLMHWFDELRQIDQFDESTADFMRRAYV